MPEATRENFSFFLVAYIDILGFSKMVESDISNPTNNDLFLTKLYEIFENTRSRFSGYEKLQVIQFSDSVVFSFPNSRANVPIFLNIVKEFQFSLYERGLLCRGGVAFGKHFYNNGFLFSDGLIEAYNLEKNHARYPRIVVSKNLLYLHYPEGIEPDCPLLKENDDTHFIDFIPPTNVANSASILRTILINNPTSDESIDEKYRWLREYLDFKIQRSDEEIIRFSNPRFS
jgi:hypothetical protein